MNGFHIAQCGTSSSDTLKTGGSDMMSFDEAMILLN
jgi:hypothetical protein